MERLTTDKNSEKFFKVFYDRMREAQAEIKATVSVNTGDGLSGTKPEGGGDAGKDDVKKKRTCPAVTVQFIELKLLVTSIY